MCVYVCECEPAWPCVDASGPHVCRSPPRPPVLHRQEGLLGQLRPQLWAALQPLVLARGAREADTASLRAAGAVNLSLYDMFNSA
jgi:hypothetical protein